MGVNNLWKSLVKGNAVRTLEGSVAGQLQQILQEVENRVIAVDLSAWLMQAQTQPALLEHYSSDYARAVKVVFDRTIHWLRHGCLPVFVIEGRTPAAKLERLRQRCVAQYGPTTRAYNVGNRAGGQFDRIGQAVKRLLEAFGVPCVQAVGEGEAMCSALNLCGWVHACQTFDVDALLFGALTVYKELHLQTDDPRKSKLTICRRSDVQQVLGISSGGDAALMAVAQLAGGDYDTAGADNVGEAMALSAVRCLLKGCEDDADVLHRLEAAVTAGPNPGLNLLTHCTGCKLCGHEGGCKTSIKRHPAKRPCFDCGVDEGCIERDFGQCQCAFHSTADERLLNRVIRRATQTPGFVSSCRAAAAAYADQVQQAIAEVQREYGLSVPGSSVNVFSWRARPDVRGIADIMCRYIKDWDYSQVRLKLLPLLLEWDVRQGPSANPSAGVQLRPVGIRKVSGKGISDTEKGISVCQQQGWRYVLLVERWQQQQQVGPASNTSSAQAASELNADTAEDLQIDLAWINGTARVRKPKAAASELDGASTHQQGGRDQDGDDAGADEAVSCSQADVFSQNSMLQAAFSQGRSGQAAGDSGSGGSSCNGGYFAEHRSVRCTLVDAVWGELVERFRNPPASSGRARPGSGRARHKTAKATAAAAGSAPAEPDKQRSLKDFFATAKDYSAAARPAGKAGGRLPGTSGIIPGLAGIAGSTAMTGTVAAAATAVQPAGGRADGIPAEHSTEQAAQAAGGSRQADVANDTNRSWQRNSSSGRTLKKPEGASFIDWLEGMQQHTPVDVCSFAKTKPSQEPYQPLQQQQKQQQQQQREQQQNDIWGYDADPSSLTAAQTTNAEQRQQIAPAAAASAAAAVVRNSNNPRRLFVGMQGSSNPGSRSKPAAAGRTPRKITRNAMAVCMQPGAMDQFLRPCASQFQISLQQQQQQQCQHAEEGKLAAVQQDTGLVTIDCSDSPEMLPLAARLAITADGNVAGMQVAGKAAAIAMAAAAAAGKHAVGITGMSDLQSMQNCPAKKASTDRAKEQLSSPAKPWSSSAAGTGNVHSSPAYCAEPCGIFGQQQQWGQEQHHHAAAEQSAGVAAVGMPSLSMQFQHLTQAYCDSASFSPRKVNNQHKNRLAKGLFSKTLGTQPAEHQLVAGRCSTQQCTSNNLVDIIDLI